MSRIRTIKPEFWISEQVMNCSHSARLLFIGLWNFCDDGGVHPANIRKLKAEVFPGDDVTLTDVEGWMKELISQKLVAEFTAQYNNESCTFWFVTGWKHQRIDKPYLKYPDYKEQQASASTSLSTGAAAASAAAIPPRPFDEHSTTIPRTVEEHSTQVVEGKGKEGKGVEEEDAQALDAPPITMVAAPLEATAPEAKQPKTHKASKPVKGRMTSDWTPAETTYALLEKHGIPRSFAEGCIDEFRLYWQERGESRPGWEASFVNNAKRQWAHRPREAIAKRNSQLTPPPRDMTPEVAEFEAILRGVQRPVIEGECHATH
jgi:hypothetical protein